MSITPPPRILVVDDDQAMRQLLVDYLSGHGLIVDSAATGAQAQAAVQATQYDMVLLDLGLPDGDGKQVISEIRNWSSVPIVILSARTQESEKVEALDAGADDYLVKPFGMPELLARMRAQLRRHAHAACRPARATVFRPAASGHPGGGAGSAIAGQAV